MDHVNANAKCSIAATMTKIIKEMLPPDVRVARDTQDLLIECCVGEISLFFTHYSLRRCPIMFSSILCSITPFQYVLSLQCCKVINFL